MSNLGFVLGLNDFLERFENHLLAMYSGAAPGFSILLVLVLGVAAAVT